ncbi:hypothetical protein C8Q74DRAFT_1371997 [Fomes fomentarius]|nr:hypothetical protein C8Q74DRAFT_1371997 [Fomes fomentarius]
MAPRYSKKKAKFTYTERVLGALSELQKEHRKHAVHMATLRAHVRKTADARKDKMGPQWSQWVSRTVERLADDGILDNSDPHGNVTFTPDAKKTITSVRRETLGPGVVPQTNLENKIWKDMQKRFSTVGVKRSRRRSSAIGLAEDEGRPSKRQARQSFSRLTKAELETELRIALRRLQEAEEPQAADEEEIEALRDELKGREHEVEELRDEVARLKGSRSTERVTIGATRLLTPPPTNPSVPCTPSSSKTARATNLRPRTSAHGMTRTLSGSLISNLTRRPTPEPSDSGSHVAEIEDMIFNHDVSPARAYREDIDDDTLFESLPDHGLGTPQSSPMLADQADLGAEPDSGNDDRSEITSLKVALQARVSELDELRDAHRLLLVQRDELRGIVTARDSRLQALEADLRARTDALSASELRKAELGIELCADKGRLQDVEAKLQASFQALDAEKRLQLSLQEKHANLRDMVESLQGKVRQLSLHSTSLESDLRDAQRQVSEWQSAHQESESHREQATSELDNVKEKLLVVGDALQKAEASHKVEIAQLKLDRENLQAELAVAAQAIEVEKATNLSLSKQTTTLERQLKDDQDRNLVLVASNENLTQTVTHLKDYVEELNGDVSHAKEQASAVEAALQKSQDLVVDLRRSHAQALSDGSSSARQAAALHITVLELQSSLDMLRSQLRDTAAGAAEVRAQLETEQASRRRAECELVATKEECKSLLADIADKTAHVGKITEELKQVRQAEEDARRAILDLESQWEKDVAVHVTERSAIESNLETARAEVAALKSHLDATRSDVSALNAELQGVVAERDQLSLSLKNETARTSKLEEELSVALDDVRDAEDEIQELRQAKMTDEGSITTLKEALERLRQVQINALEEVNKAASAQTAPTPGHRRRSSVAFRSGVGRLA